MSLLPSKVVVFVFKNSHNRTLVNTAMNYFIKLIFIICEFRIMYPNLIHIPFLLHPLVNTSLLVSVHCTESFIWFEASGICYTMDIGPSMGVLLDTMLLPYIMETLQLQTCRSRPRGCCFYYVCLYTLSKCKNVENGVLFLGIVRCQP